jgi:hypothetical protein
VREGKIKEKRSINKGHLSYFTIPLENVSIQTEML